MRHQRTAWLAIALLGVGWGLSGMLGSRLVSLNGARGAEPVPAQPLLLTLQKRRQSSPDKPWETETTAGRFLPQETALLICDLWDDHWCRSAARRTAELAEKIGPLVEAARRRGVHIIHAPSDTIDYYRDSPARKRILDAPAATPPVPIAGWQRIDNEREPALPIDDSDGGCDDQPRCEDHKAWSREHPAVRVADEDVVSDDGVEIYNYLVQQGIRNIFYVGVHTNMCVLGRSFGIRQMTREGLRTVLVRDLTDALYNPRSRPFVSQAEGTQLVIEHVEKYWCPTTTGAELMRQLQ